MPINDPNDQPSTPAVRLFGRQRPLHAILGGGTVADVLLWKNNNLLATLFIGFTAIWFLFEIVEYHFLTLLCHTLIISMLLVFIWFNLALLLDWSHPKLPEDILSENAFKEIVSTFHKNLNQFLPILYDIACGKDLQRFVMVVASLWILGVIGTYFSTLNLLYLCFLCIVTLPALYQRYEDEVDYLASRGKQDMIKLYKKLDSEVLKKIPRGPVKENKIK